MSLTIYCLNGPNLNLLGEREPAIYGKSTLADLEKLSHEAAAAVGATLVFRQSNHEGELVDWVQEARRQAAAVVKLLDGETNKVGFASGSKAFGHRYLLGYLEQRGLARGSVVAL